MRIERIQGNEERRILTAMIVDSIALGRIAGKWEREMFRSRWADIVGQWCVTYHNSYGKAPRKAIQGLFENWAAETQDKDTISMVEKFLVSLDGEYAALAKESNSDHIVDAAASHFTTVKLQKLFERGQADLDAGKASKAVERVLLFNKVEMGTASAVDLLHDDAALAAAFEGDAEDIIEYPGALGAFFKGQLARDAFIAFLAPEKRGKTFWLIDIGWQAMLQRKRVAWFAAGDMSERQMIRRFAIRAARRPLKSKEWPCEIKVPEAIRRRDGIIQIKHATKIYDAPLNLKQAREAFQEVSQFKVKSNDCYLKLETYPNSTLSVKMMDAQLTKWAQEGWVADVVIVDYADILDESAALPGATAPRDATNASWKGMRRLSQTHHCLFITATQADAEGGVTELLRRNNFSEDKRKLAHVTGMAGINQSETEKKIGAYRLNWIVLREGDFTESQTVAVASCLALGNPAVKSCF